MDKKKIIIIVCATLAVILIVLAIIGLIAPKDNGYGDYKKPDAQTTDTVGDVADDTKDSDSATVEGTVGTQGGDIKFEIDGDGNLVNPGQNSNTGNNTGNGNTGNENTGNGNNGNDNNGTGNNGSDNTESGDDTDPTDSTETTGPQEKKQEADFNEFFKEPK